MSSETFSLINGLLGLMGLAIQVLVAVTALVVAFILTLRRSNRLAAWLLFLACGAHLVLMILQELVVTPVLAGPLVSRWGPAGVQWAFAATRALMLGVSVVFGIGVLLCRPPAAQGGGRGTG